MKYRFLLLITLYAFPAAGQADQIRLNQIGFYPDAPKIAVVVDSPADAFFITSPEGADTVFAGTLSGAEVWSLSEESVRRADFSSLDAEGTFVIAVPGLGSSYPFRISPDVHREVARAALKSFYYQRASLALDAPYAGRWARPAGHPDDAIEIHPSAASATRPAGTIISARKGWYDAGDYNKYIVNSGITMGTLLSLYEHFPEFARALDTNIPESGDDVPDLLDEILWNLRWMLAMQDPGDGGVYHKLTTARFEGMVMPHEARNQRYVVQKGTAATLDFAAVTAQAARVFAAYDPGLSDSLRTAAVLAWEWARRNPDVLYDQRAMNTRFDPEIVTGAYGDGSVSDEFAWAAAELFVTTGADSFVVAVPPLVMGDLGVPSWPRVGTLAYYTLAHHRDAAGACVDTSRVKSALIDLADRLVEGAGRSPYLVPMGAAESDFVWGSSAVAANQGVTLIQAYRLTGDQRYLDAALANLDYLLGRNATGYSFVTGYGSKTPRHIHHRPSEADGIADPVPGLLSGGPNPRQQDRMVPCEYPTSLPAKSFVDHVCSYASNEIAINWNAPLVYLVGAIEALR